MAYTILQLHIKPTGIAPSTLLYLDCTYMYIEFGDCLLLVCRYKGIRQRRLWRLDWGNKRLYRQRRAQERVYRQDKTMIDHRWRKGRPGSQGGTSSRRRGADIRRLYRRKRAQERIYRQEKTMINHRQRKGHLGSRGGTSSCRRWTDIGIYFL